MLLRNTRVFAVVFGSICQIRGFVPYALSHPKKTIAAPGAVKSASI